MSCTKRFRGRLQQESTRDNPRGGHAMYSEACVMPRLIFSKIMTPDYPTGDNYDGYEIIAYDVPRESFPKLRKLKLPQLSK